MYAGVAKIVMLLLCLVCFYDTRAEWMDVPRAGDKHGWIQSMNSSPKSRGIGRRQYPTIHPVALCKVYHTKGR
jgi:hypothetical protein